MTTHIRPAHPIDLPDLARLWYEKIALLCQLESRLSLPADARERWSAVAQRWLEKAGCQIFVAEVDSQVVGFIIGEIMPGQPGMLPEFIGQVHEFALDMHRYHGGAGRLLVTALATWFREHEIDHMTMLAFNRFAVEQSFWRGIGASILQNRMWINL